MKAWSLHSSIRLIEGGIEAPEAARQERTAQEILRRLEHQPGVVLADEVGMGKTFVALAIAASVASRSDQPVVVMCPPGLADKWERDAKRFAHRCYIRGAGGAPFARKVNTGGEFLRCFDDPPDARAHLVILPNTALHKAETDPWIRLSAIKRALSHVKASDARIRTVARYARRILRSSLLAGMAEEHFEKLLNKRIDGWRSYLQNECKVDLKDDPVPEAFYTALKGGHLSSIAAALDAVPMRESASLDQRLDDARKEVAEALKDVWVDALREAQISSPLLICDEAHHLKNDETRLAKLFQQDEPAAYLSGTFDRMLFLTATPFQLGHHELLGVLDRFSAVTWKSLGGEKGKARFAEQRQTLAQGLDHAQHCSLTLDRLWGSLGENDVALDAGGEVPTDVWEALAGAPPTEGHVGAVMHQYQRTRAALKTAEQMLAPWVVRHLRARSLGTESERRPRRQNLAGRAVHDGQHTTAGIELVGETRFPFLLCARAQGLLARTAGRRAYFAEGLASSYGAFLYTSKPADDPATRLSDGEDAGQVRWYVKQVREVLGEKHDASSHPKIAATVECAIRHWSEGHKVLVFAHFRRTISDLTDALRQRLAAEIERRGAAVLGLESGRNNEVKEQLSRISVRLADANSPLHREVWTVLAGWVDEWNRRNSALHAARLLDESLKRRVVSLMLRTLRSPSFMVRHLPLDRPEVRQSLSSARTTAVQSRDAANAVAHALTLRHHAGRASYQQRVEKFLQHMTDDLATDEERVELLDALEEAHLHEVEFAHGDVPKATRQRRLHGFNSPLMPEILVASEVLAEGLDLHLDCRHIIHHDLSWNPSTLEQRTGRVDRLRCKADLDGESIHVYMPYLAGTADEKMYRVVTDRARWFQVVMGEKYTVDESTTEALSRRIPFPEAAARALMFSLEVPVGGESESSYLVGQPNEQSTQ